MTKTPGSERPGTLSLVVLQGPDRGKATNLQENREYIIGRSQDCDIQVDQSDRSVSRKHVRLKTRTSNVLLENLSQTNPVQINGKAVSTATIKPNDRFQVGISVFALQITKGHKTSSFFRPDKKIILLAGLLIVSLFFLFVLLMGKDDTPVQPASNTRPAASEPDKVQKMVSHDAVPSLPGISGVTVSDEDREKSDEHFRQGMFYYDTGNIVRAVGEWKRALSINPDHSDARIWFLKVENELEEKAKTHYQNAMLHYKYMRYEQAAYEFRMVLELSRDKNSDQYINSLRYINELQGR